MSSASAASALRLGKSSEEKQLRKDLGRRLHVLDNDLVNGFFHDEENEDKFLQDEFHFAVDPIIQKIIGEVYQPDNLPEFRFRMASDIVKRRRRYLFKALGKKPIKINKKPQRIVFYTDSSDDDTDDKGKGDSDQQVDDDDSECDGDQRFRDESVPGAAADYYEDMLKLQKEVQDYRKGCKEKVNADEAAATATTEKKAAATATPPTVESVSVHVVIMLGNGWFVERPTQVTPPTPQPTTVTWHVPQPSPPTAPTRQINCHKHGPLQNSHVHSRQQNQNRGVRHAAKVLLCRRTHGSWNKKRPNLKHLPTQLGLALSSDRRWMAVLTQETSYTCIGVTTKE